LKIIKFDGLWGFAPTPHITFCGWGQEIPVGSGVARGQVGNAHGGRRPWRRINPHFQSFKNV